MEYADMTQRMKDGIVTVELQTSNDTDVDSSLDAVRRKLQLSVVRILNAESAAAAEKNESAAAATRRRRTSGKRYDDGGVGFVSVDPAVKDDALRVSLIAESQDGDVLAAETLKNELNENKDQLSTDTGMSVGSIYVGLPADVRPVIPHDDRPTIWDRHFWMFMGVIILLGVALLVLLLCCICFRCCRGRKRSGSGDEPLQKKHAPVEEMVELAPVAPLQSAPPPMRQTPSDPLAGYEPPASTDDENGWIIPIDQLTPEELEQPDVQISRL